MQATERVISPLPADPETIQPLPLVFYCKTCRKLISAQQTKKKFKFKCPLCQQVEVAFGTEPSIRNFYRIPA